MPVNQTNMNAFLEKCLCSEVSKAELPKSIKLQMKYEAVLAARMLNSYNSKARKAIKRVAGMVEKGRSLQDIKKALRTQMNKIFSEAEKNKISKDIRRYFAADRSLAANEFKIDIADEIKSITLKGTMTIIKQNEISVAFDIKDRQIVELIESQNLIAATNLYKAGLSAHVVQVITKILKDTGLSRTQQKARIQSELTIAMGLKAGVSGLKDIVPPKFNGTSKDYFTGLAETTLTRAQSMGRLNLFKQGDFKNYYISAILDHRTSVICQMMDGRTFSIDQGEEQVNNILAAKSADDLKRVAGWQRDLTKFGVPLDQPDKFKSGPGSSQFSKSLADAGLALPPYHFRCRTTVRPL